MVFGKKVAISDWEWGRNSAPREGQKIPCKNIYLLLTLMHSERPKLHRGLAFLSAKGLRRVQTTRL